MPYNAGMTQLTLVLPFALPPAELAPDLVRALQAPALAALLSRTSSHATLPLNDNIRATPHEAWLAQTLGLSADGHPAFAAAAMRGMGLDPGSDSWFIINPAHIQITRNHLTMNDLRGLRLTETEARPLFDVAKPYFDEIGKTLLYGDAATWFMRAGDWSDLATSSPDASVGLNLTDWLPSGPHAVNFRKLQNEVQMLWFEHPVNVERESRGLPAINSFWPWAPSKAGKATETTLAASQAPGWLAALATSWATPAELMSGAIGDTIVLAGELSESAIGGDWASWIDRMHQLEKTLFAPALASLLEGRVNGIRLLLSHRTAHIQLTTSRMAQRAFWRRPTLNRLLP